MRSAILLLVMLPSVCFARGADVPVHGYTKADGTYVRPYMRTAPDGTTANNYSAAGNYNPYTGAYGTKNTPLPAYGYAPYSPYAPPAASQNWAQSWIGHNAGQLLVRFGTPYKTHKQKDDGTSYEYADSTHRLEFFVNRYGMIYQMKSWGYNF